MALAGVLGVAGCGDSPTSQSNKAASEASDKAARMTASAGDFRPTDALTRRVNSGEDPAKIALDIKTKISRDVDADKGLYNVKGAYKDFIGQKSISEDLTEAAKYLSAGLATGAPEPEFKALLQAQSGQIANEKAQLRLTSLENSLRELANEAVDIQLQAADIASLGSQAGVADLRGKLGPKDLPKSVEDAKTALDQAKREAADKAQAAAAVKGDIDKDRAEAQKLYDQSAADLQAADQAKGMGSIDAYNKAIAVRGRADQLAADATSLQPKLLAAVDDAHLAQIQATDAEEALRALTVATDAFGNRTKGATAEATDLAAAAGKLANDPVTGLSAKLKAFKILAETIDGEVDQAAREAKSAKDSFEKALGDLGKYRQDISDKRDTFKDNDPLLKVGQDRKPEAMMYLCKASAEYRAGEANLVNMTAASLQDSVAQSVGAAYKAAGITADAPAGAGDKLSKARDAAKASFDEAKKALDTVVGDRPAIMLAEIDPPKWLGYTLKAVVCQGLALASTDAGQQQAARSEAETAAKAAMERNPSLQLQQVVGP